MSSHQLGPKQEELDKFFIEEGELDALCDVLISDSDRTPASLELYPSQGQLIDSTNVLNDTFGDSEKSSYASSISSDPVSDTSSPEHEIFFDKNGDVTYTSRNAIKIESPDKKVAQDRNGNEIDSKKQVRLERNRRAAQEFRKRKKEYVKELEAKIEELERENVRLNIHVSSLTAENTMLKNEKIFFQKLLAGNMPTFGVPSIENGAGQLVETNHLVNPESKQKRRKMGSFAFAIFCCVGIFYQSQSLSASESSIVPVSYDTDYEQAYEQQSSIILTDSTPVRRQLAVTDFGNGSDEETSGQELVVIMDPDGGEVAWAFDQQGHSWALDNWVGDSSPDSYFICPSCLHISQDTNASDTHNPWLTGEMIGREFRFLVPSINLWKESYDQDAHTINEGLAMTEIACGLTNVSHHVYHSFPTSY